MRNRIIVVSVAVLLMAIGASADVTVTNLSFPDWHLISGNTFALPAASNCGVENELDCEPVGNFLFNVGFTSGTGNYNIVDFDGSTNGELMLSDQIQVFNDPFSGLGRVLFYSDPNLGGLTWDGQTYLCNENDGNGCVGTITVTGSDGSTITINVASDSESVFDPFGFNADTSDQIQILGATPIEGVPEPSSLILLGSGLAGLAGTIRRKLSL